MAESCWTYDPAYSNSDLKLIKHYKINIISSNEVLLFFHFAIYIML